jgi:hypothetical protein
MRRTQIYLDEQQHEALARRAAAEGRTQSELIREAVDHYLDGAAEDRGERLARFRAAVRAAAGSIPRLPSGTDYVRELREADLARERELEQRWRA